MAKKGRNVARKSKNKYLATPKMKKDPAYNFLFESKLSRNYKVKFESTINIPKDQIDNFYSNPTNERQLASNLQRLEAPNWKSSLKTTSLSIVPKTQFLDYHDKFDAELAADNGLVVLPNGDKVSYDWIWANRDAIHYHKTSKQNLDFKNKEKHIKTII